LDEEEGEKFPFIKNLSKYWIEAVMSLMYLSNYSPKSFILRERRMILRFPANPCAPPRYYFL
jgi:hypothetical protein